MTYDEVPVGILLGERMFICNAARTFTVEVPPRKRARALAAAQQEFAIRLRHAIRSEAVPTWDFT